MEGMVRQEALPVKAAGNTPPPWAPRSEAHAGPRIRAERTDARQGRPVS